MCNSARWNSRRPEEGAVEPTKETMLLESRLYYENHIHGTASVMEVQQQHASMQIHFSVISEGMLLGFTAWAQNPSTLWNSTGSKVDMDSIDTSRSPWSGPLQQNTRWYSRHGHTTTRLLTDLSSRGSSYKTLHSDFGVPRGMTPIPAGRWYSPTSAGKNSLRG